MDIKNKDIYVAPSTRALNVVQSGVVCNSQMKMISAPTYNGFNTEEEW